MAKGTDGRATEYRIGVDIGGTFTDMVVVDDSGIVAVGKVLTTPSEPARAVEQVIRETLGSAGIDPRAVTGFIHGTTLVTNALIERKGSTTAVLATAGFRDTLEMRREHRYDLYDLMLELPEPLAPRWLRFDVPERVLADGSIGRELDVEFVERLAVELEANGVEAVAVSFLHSFTNPVHEQQAKDAIKRVAPSLRVALSSEVVPEIREYERTSTTVANVYVQRLTETYLTDLRDRSRGIGIPREPHIILSNGGVATVPTAAAFPIRMLESGPAGGALAAATYGAAHGHSNLLAFDMGGTTAKLCMIANAEPLVTHEFEVGRVYRMKPGSGLPVRIPVIDMIEIGVGGGSIARIDALGLLTVGPESAGSEPGPACYGRGGTSPTVTDADLVLGYLNAEYFLGGQMALDLEGARHAIDEHIAGPLGVTVEQAAYGIHASVNENMANAARVHAIERGMDPEGQPMFTSGGAGPVHAAGVASSLGASQVICAPAAGVQSAFGFLTAPLSFDLVRSSYALVDELDGADVEAIFSAMESEGESILLESGMARDLVTHRRYAELRYSGQGFEVSVPLPTSSADWRATLRDGFRTAYEDLYQRQSLDMPLEVLSWRVVSGGPAPNVGLQEKRTRHASQDLAPSGERDAYFPDLGGYHSTPVFDRYTLRSGDRIAGPAIIEERESTLILVPQSVCEVGVDGSLILHIGQGTNESASRNSAKVSVA